MGCATPIAWRGTRGANSERWRLPGLGGDVVEDVHPAIPLFFGGSRKRHRRRSGGGADFHGVGGYAAVARDRFAAVFS